MKIEQIELVHISMPLNYTFETSFDRWSQRECILVAASGEGLTGWGECAALARPAYSYETSGTAWHVLAEFIAPSVLGKAWDSIEALNGMTGWIRGHPMAKSGLQAAAWDLLAQRDGISLAAKLAEPYTAGSNGPIRRSRVPVGVSIGIQPSIDATLEQIGQEIELGYGRVKLKIKPGHDLALARAARDAFPYIPLMIDANSSYTLADADLFRQMDDLGLLMIEQPLAHDDIYQHSKLQTLIRTPICLDESIHTPEMAQWAVEIGAARIINIKPGRVGGLLEGRKIHDICRRAGIPVWCGGMIETGVGRTANLAIASLPGFTLPGDISATDHYWEQDIIDEQITLNSEDSTITVPDQPGLGVTVNRQRIQQFRLKSEIIKA
ncbi:MAG: o-succinylbenzoate synthase [Anaerolineales bacterium]|nr:o-succinylbenzoate synthase [Anaerolineales bacterium]